VTLQLIDVPAAADGAAAQKPAKPVYMPLSFKGDIQISLAEYVAKARGFPRELLVNYIGYVPGNEPRRMHFHQPHQTIGLPNRQGPQQQRIRHAEDQRVDADSDSQQERYGESKNRAMPKQPQTESHIAPEVRHRVR